MTTEFVFVGRLSDLRDHRGMKVMVGEYEVALWKVGNAVYAVGNVCAHQHFSMMHQGTVEGSTVRCPMHGWEYSLETGRSIEGSGRIPVFEVKIEGDRVSVSLEPRQ